MKLVVPSRSSKNLLEKATAEYQNQLPGSPGESHLLARGISQQSIEHFRLGYVNSPISGDERYKGRLSIPYLTVTGVVTMRFRTTTDEDPKYLSVSGDPGRPFNVADLSGSAIFLTEGEIDAITLHQMGYASLGIPGATQWNSLYCRLLRFRRTYLLADGDKAGRDFAEAVGSDIRGLTVLHMPSGEDVNSMFVNKGISYFEELING